MNRTTDGQPLMTAEMEQKCQSSEIMKNEGKVLPLCYRCAQVPKNGLYDGFRIAGMFFCSDCLQKMLMAEQDSSEYQEFLFLIKGLLYS